MPPSGPSKSLFVHVEPHGLRATTSDALQADTATSPTHQQAAVSALITKAGDSRVYLAAATELLLKEGSTLRAEDLPESLDGLYELVFRQAVAGYGDSGADADAMRRLLLVLMEARQPPTLRELHLLGLERQRRYLPLWGSLWFERQVTRRLLWWHIS